MFEEIPKETFGILKKFGGKRKCIFSICNLTLIFTFF